MWVQSDAGGAMRAADDFSQPCVRSAALHEGRRDCAERGRLPGPLVSTQPFAGVGSCWLRFHDDGACFSDKDHTCNCKRRTALYFLDRSSYDEAAIALLGLTLLASVCVSAVWTWHDEQITPPSWRGKCFVRNDATYAYKKETHHVSGVCAAQILPNFRC